MLVLFVGCVFVVCHVCLVVIDVFLRFGVSYDVGCDGLLLLVVVLLLLFMLLMVSVLVLAFLMMLSLSM